MAASTNEKCLVTVGQFSKAMGAGKLDEACSLLHHDFVVHEAGGLPYSGDYRGPNGFVELVRKMNDVLELTPGHMTQHALSDDTVASMFRLTFTSRASRKSIQMGLVEVYTVRDGLITELDVYYKDPSAVAALLEQPTFRR
jgi:ketosteroid isomerase-like protein